MKENTLPSVDKVYQYILDRLTSKTLFPGMQIVETDIEKEIGISRTPIRAAIQKLSYEGLVKIIPYKGAFVVQPTYEEICSAYECKKILETEATKLACLHIKEEELSHLEKLLKNEEEFHNQLQVHDFYRMNKEFHMIIAKASRNEYLEKYIGELMNKCDIYLIFYDTLMTPAHTSSSYKEHAKILKTLRERNGELAAEAMKRHNAITLKELNIPRI